jgi:glycerophosphoryl diester phosphodiesterase
VDADDLDIHLSKDGQLVVIHDDTTGRTAGPPDTKVADLTVAQLKQLDVGWKGRFPEKIPLLEEVFPLIPAGKRIFIDVKVGPEFIAPLQALFRRTGADPGKFTIIGFNYEAMRLAKVAFPNIEVLWLAFPQRDNPNKPPVEELIKTARKAGLDGLDLDYNFPIDRKFVDRVHDAGLKLYTWTVNDPEVARKEVEAGVDGITSNRAAWLRSQLAPRP